MPVEGRKFGPPYITCELTPVNCKIIGISNDRIIDNIDKPGSKPAFQLTILKINTSNEHWPHEYTKWITDGDIIWGVSIRCGAPSTNRFIIVPTGPIPPQELVLSMIDSYLNNQLQL